MSAILVIDDRAIERDLLATVLGYAGHAVLEVSNGREGLRIARTNRPDLIIVDLNMPEMNGYEFVRELRADPVTDSIRVVFCTATYEQDEVRRLADSLGVSHVLLKPCEPEEVVRVVSLALAVDASPGAPVVTAEFDREQLRVLNAKLVQMISELERLQLELRSSQRQTAEGLTLLETLQSSSPVGFGFVDRDFRMRQMNDMLASFSRLPLDRQLGLKVAEMVPDLWPQIEPLFQRVLDTGEPILNQEVRGEIPAAPGEVHLGLASYYPVRIDDELIGIGMVVVDITDRQAAEDLREVVMRNMAEGLVVSDADGLLMFMNAAASQMTGWTEDELRGRSVHDLIHYQHADGSAFPAEECPTMNIPQHRKTVRVAQDAYTRKDGTIFPVAYSAAPLLSSTAVRGIVVVFRDTTVEQDERNRAQRELNALSWVGRIRDALDDDRLVLYSQPIVALSAGGTGGEELLIRMIGSKGEVIPPGSFIPVAEKYGLIGEIDQWVIRQAVLLAAEGRNVHANLSADSISNPELLAVIEQELKSAGADPASIIFELTETALMGNLTAGEAFARGIDQIGCSVALDDFGTGYGSFTYLQKLKIAYLKIDIAFVRDLLTNPTNQHLVKATVNIAQGLGQKTIAEGVENEETLDLLREYGIDYAQGFHLGRPGPLI